MERKLLIAEFFSGIGGWSCAFSQISSLLPRKTEVVIALDINTVSNAVYEHNFHLKPSAKSIEKLPVKAIDSLRADIWVMSPPCQPFTRNNETSSRDDADARSDALLAVISMLQRCRHPPTYLILENVVGFETSNCCRNLLCALHEESYHVQQYILSPTQLGIPNERPRYYLLARKSSPFQPTRRHEILREFPPSVVADSSQQHRVLDYIDDDLEEAELNDLLVPQDTLRKSASWCLDIVTPSSTVTACFTKSYGRFSKGTGSVLLVRRDDGPVSSADCSSGRSIEESKVLIEGSSLHPKDDVCHEDTNNNEFLALPGQRMYDENWWLKLGGRQLRYFSPKELLRIFGFCSPRGSEFDFPAGVTRKKCYELIGNSINVTVASVLLKELLSDMR